METQSGVSKSNCKSPKSLLKTSVMKLQLSETSETASMLENSVKEEKEDRLVNCQKQGPGRRTVFCLQMSMLEWQIAYIQRKPGEVILMKTLWGWQCPSYSQHFVKVKEFLKFVATGRIWSCWTMFSISKFYKAILQQNNQVTWKKNSIWKLQQMIDSALQNMFPIFCSSFTRLLVLQPKLSVTTSGCGEREQNCAVLTTAKKTGKSGHVIGDICH